MGDHSGGDEPGHRAAAPRRSPHGGSRPAAGQVHRKIPRRIARVVRDALVAPLRQPPRPAGERAEPPPAQAATHSGQVLLLRRLRLLLAAWRSGREAHAGRSPARVPYP
jgi:hypothetical protein